MNCINCGTPLNDDAKFCTKCGTNNTSETNNQQNYPNLGIQSNCYVPSAIPQSNFTRKPNNSLHIAIHFVMTIIIIILAACLVDASKEYTSLYNKQESLEQEYYDYQNRSAEEKTLDAIDSWFN